MLWRFFSPKSHPQKVSSKQVLSIPAGSFVYICPDFQVSVSENRTVSVVIKQNDFGKLKPTLTHWIWVGQMQMKSWETCALKCFSHYLWDKRVVVTLSCQSTLNHKGITGFFRASGAAMRSSNSLQMWAVFSPSSFQTRNPKSELLLESFPARADSGLEAALLPVSSLWDC